MTGKVGTMARSCIAHTISTGWPWIGSLYYNNLYLVLPLNAAGSLQVSRSRRSSNLATTATDNNMLSDRRKDGNYLFRHQTPRPLEDVEQRRAMRSELSVEAEEAKEERDTAKLARDTYYHSHNCWNKWFGF